MSLLSRSISAILCCILLLATPVTTGAKALLPPGMLHFNLENGLPSDHIYSVVQDKASYIWICTDNGLVKYNGYDFKVFNTSNGLPSNDIWYVTEDNHGRLWIHNYAYEIGYIKNDVYHKINPGFSSIFRTTKVFSAGPHTIIEVYGGGVKDTLLAVDAQDKLSFIHTHGYNLFAFDKAPIFYRSQTQGAHAYIPYMRQGHLSVKKGGNFPKAMGLDKVLNEFSVPIDRHVVFFQQESHDFILANYVTCTKKQVNFSQFGGSARERLSVVIVNNNKFIITSNDALYIIAQNFDFIRRIPYTDVFNNATSATWYLEDADKNEWFCTATDGLYCRMGSKNSFVYHSSLSPLLKDATLIGETGSNASWWFNSITLMLTGIDNSRSVVQQRKMDDKVLAIADGGDGSLYTAFHSRLLKLNTATGRLHHFLDTSSRVFESGWLDDGYGVFSKERDTVNEILPSAKEWIFRELKFLHQYDSNTFYGVSPRGLRSITVYPDSIFLRSLVPGRYSGFYYDSFYKCYWVYSKGNIAVLHPGRNIKLSLDNTLLQSIGLSSVSAIVTDRHGNIFIKDAKFILVYNSLKGVYRVLRPAINLSDVAMKCNSGQLLLAGRFGVAQAAITGPLAVGSFHIRANSQSAYYNRVYNFSVSNGADSFLLHTDRGVYLMPATLPPGFKANPVDGGQLVYEGTKPTKISDGDTLFLPPATGKALIDHINLGGKGSRAYNFSIDGEAVQESPVGEIYLGNRKPGRLYHVTMSVADELFRTKSWSFYLYIQPYWWQTALWIRIFWIAGISLFLAAILAAVLVTRYYVARTNLRKRAMVELEVRALYAQINPHFIFNTLSSALYFISKHKYEEAYTHVSKFSRLLRAYLKSSRERYVVLAEEIDLLTNYVALQKIRFEEKFEYTIEVDNRIPIDSIQIPSLLLQPLVENAINHGLFHKGKGGCLLISFKQGKNSDELICTIEDNGVGRARAKEIKAGSTIQYDSYGTKLTDDLIMLFGKYEQMDIKINYIDKSLPETGTIVTLIIRNLKYVA